MSIPTFLDVWADETGAEVELRYRWPRPPEIQGDERVRSIVESCMDNLGPYEPGAGLTFPQVQEDLETSMTGAGLRKVAVVTERSLAAEFLSAAVEEGESSAKHELKAREHRPESFDNPLEFILFWGELDRARRASRKAVMLAIASLEAHINYVATTSLSIWKEEDRLSLLDKWIIVSRALDGTTFDRGAEPLQSLQDLISLRHKLVHPKVRRERLQYPHVGTGMAEAIFAPADDAALDSGRRACMVAREVHLEFSRLTGIECPDWVNVVPPGGSVDANDWMGASMRAGLRDDPDFLSRHDHPDALPFPWIGRVDAADSTHDEGPDAS